jgi:hypothetical protein
MATIEPGLAYQILGVAPSASARAIKQAYRQLIRKWHPDLHQSSMEAHDEAMEMTRLINAAYSAIEHAPLRHDGREEGKETQQPQESPPVRSSQFRSRKRRRTRVKDLVVILAGAVLMLKGQTEIVLDLHNAGDLFHSSRKWVAAAALGAWLVLFGVIRLFRKTRHGF